jgi:putative flippase GtrA
MKNSIQSCFYLFDLKEFIKFIIVGFSNFVISFTIFYLLYKKWHFFSFLLEGLGRAGNILSNFISTIGIKTVDASFANIISYIFGLINSFILNRFWTFKACYESMKQFKRFVILNISCLALSTFTIFIFIDILNWPYKIVWITVMSFIMILNFIINKHWVFKKGL